ncbi:MAG TPA: VOC family protein [Alphaproteobacteria bacterium]|jgi:catechol 2,3-dioxygenase-like lactoylglutathione lyase family enzyme
MMLNLQKLVHFTIPVKDLDRAEAFYTGLLGLQKIRRNPHMLFLRCGGDHFVLTHSERPVDPNPPDRHEIHTAFLVAPAGYDAALKTLADHGVRVFLEEDRQRGTFQGRSAYFHDPDGNVLELIDLRNDPASDSGA